MWLLLGWSGAWVPLSWCVVLGAILAPTDPIAVGAVMARVGLPPRLQAVIVGESLFNDGVGVVVFNSALGFALSPGDIGSGHIILEFLIETGGAVIIGLVTGWLGFELMRRVDEHILEITISLAVATGGYALAQAVDVSGPVTVVVSGLLIGSRGRQLAMSEDTAERFSAFWALIDELLNAILFIVIGLELFDITFGSVPTWLLVVAPLLAVVVRLIAVVATTRWLHAGTEQYWRRTGIVTWAGLRGGISVALALSLPYGVWTERILLVTYVVVVFSIIVQGLTMEWFARFIRVAQG
jgi:CPA1 family monovalent cation:H+ antiporter